MEHIDSLTLFQQKMNELKKSHFFDFYFIKSKRVEFKLDWRKINNGSIMQCSLNEPDEEFIKAFILPFRFFIQKKEKCSIQYLAKNIFSQLEDSFPDDVKKFDEVRKQLNNYLDSQSDFRFKIVRGNKSKEFKTRRDFLKTFIYGNYAHANIKDEHKEWYDFLHLHADEGIKGIERNLFRSEAYNVLLTLTNFFGIISILINKILDKIINYDFSQAEKAFKKGQFEKARKYYHNALYTVEKLEDKNLRANLCKKLNSIYTLLNDKVKASAFLGKYKEIKNSIKELPSNFWEDEYYREYYRLPTEYKSMIEKVLLNYQNLYKSPIIILPLNRVYEANRFKNLIVAKNFRLSYNSSEEGKVILFYEQMVTKNKNESLWAHEKFEFNPKKGFVCCFPFLDNSGLLFITNSPALFIERYFVQLEIQNIVQNLGLYYIVFNQYIDYLIDIEQNRKIEEQKFEEFKTSKELDTMNYSLHGCNKINLHIKGFRRIMGLLMDISISPRLKEMISLNNKMENIKNQSILPYLKNNFKGQSWFSFALTVIYYTFSTNDESIFEQIKTPELAKLRKICKIINGKPFSSDFFEKFYEFCNKYIAKYLF